MRKRDGTKTETMTETLQLIMDQLIPEDKHKENALRQDNSGPNKTTTVHNGQEGIYYERS